MVQDVCRIICLSLKCDFVIDYEKWIGLSLYVHWDIINGE